MQHILSEIQSNSMIYMVMLLIVGDTILGFLRSCKEKTINSSVGINGLIRKTAIISTLIIAFIADVLFDFNLIFFIPTQILDFIKIKEVGILEVFGLLFIIFELLSILKNLDRMGIPVPKKIKSMLEKVLNELTTEENKEEKKQ